MSERPRILIAEPQDFSPRAVELLAGAGEVELRAVDAAGFAAALAEYDVVWFRLAHQVTRELLARPGRRCRILATPVTGLDHIDRAACRELGVRVVSLYGETAFLRTVRATAELTIALMLAVLRRVPAAAASVAAGHWLRDRFRGRELSGSVVGLVGVGRLGSLVAGYLRAFGARVIGYDPRPDFPGELCERVASLAELCAAADLVSLHVTYDASTRHLIGAHELAAMRPDAILVNTSRGGVIDEAALLAALQAGRLGGAALDVLDGEPAVAENPLRQYARDNPDRLLITPHIGGNTVESFAKTELFLAGRVLEALGS